MRTNFIQRYLDPGAGATGLDPVSAGIAGLQGALGIIQTISGDAKAKRLRSQRTAYKTPQEIFKILQATEQNMGGYDPTTLGFLTNQTDRAFDQATGAATRLGANPNDLSAIFDQKIQGIMKIGADNHALNMEQFGKYLSALDTVASNKAAEWKSKEDMIKDDIQSATAEKAAGIQNIGSAANAFISMNASAKTADLYTDKTTKDALATAGAPVGIDTDWLMKNNKYAKRFP